MVTLSPLQRRRRTQYPKVDITTHLPVFAFTDAHRKELQAGTLILSTMHTHVADIVRRGSVYILITTNGREKTVPPSLNLNIQRPAVPVPLPPKFDPTVIPAESEYTSLSLPMRRALDYFAWASWKAKPHTNTVRALEKRNIVLNNRATPYGSALYRAYGRHDKEV